MLFRRRRFSELEKAREAREAAEKSQEHVKKQQPEVTFFATAFREIRERNHLGEQLEEIMKRHRTQDDSA
jgi:hypothetical protein